MMTVPSLSWTVIVTGRMVRLGLCLDRVGSDGSAASSWLLWSASWSRSLPWGLPGELIIGSGVRDPGRAVGMEAEEDVWMARREAATVAWVRSTVTGWEEAWARSFPWAVVRRRVGRWALWWEWRKALRRLVRRRGGVALGAAMVGRVAEVLEFLLFFFLFVVWFVVLDLRGGVSDS